MKKLNLRTKMKNSFIEVPTAFVDTFMPSYNETTLKCYLYLLRASMDHSILLSISDLADLFDVTENKIVCSLSVLEKDHLISLEYDHNEISDIVLLDFSEKVEEEISPVPEKVERPASSPMKTATPLYDDLRSREEKQAVSEFRPIDYNEIFSDNKFSDLCSLAEYLTKKQPLPQSDIHKLADCYFLYHKNQEIIEQLILYCVKEGHTSFHYMKNVCENWKKQNLLTVKEIEEYTKVRSKKVSTVMKAYGISGRHLVDAEIQYVERWFCDFSEEVIRYACERTVSNTGQASFQYTDKMLSAWKDQNVKTKEDIDLLDKQFARSKKTTKETPVKPGMMTDYKQRSVDMNSIAANFYE